MDEVKGDQFEIAMLLGIEELQLRHIAKEKIYNVGQYFSLLTDFLTSIPATKTALKNFSLLESGRDDYRSINNMIMLMEKLHCETFLLDFYKILNSYGKNVDARETSVFVKQIQDRFFKFSAKVADAKRNSTKTIDDRSLSLEEVIKRVDEEEDNHKKIILAIDDAPAILTTIASVLSSEYKVFKLPKPEKLEEVLEKLTPDLFLLDYLMPNMTGLELIPIIRNLDRFKTTPIIFLTSDHTIDTVTSAMAMGIVDYVVKPFAPDVLRQKVAQWI